jgi:hypothetical protein
MIPEERQDYPSQGEWVGWTHRYVTRRHSLSGPHQVSYHRIFSVNYLAEAAALVEEEVSLAVATADHKHNGRPKISFIVYTSPSKTFTRGRPRNLH